jgi:hypothetical protein
MSSSLVVSKIRVNTRINTLSCGLQRSSAQRLVKLDEIDSIQISLLPLRTHTLYRSPFEPQMMSCKFRD